MTNTDINTFHETSTEVGWKEELIESLRRSHQAEDWLPLSPAERDKLSEKRVKDFQAHYSLVADGIIGAKTWAALIKLDSHVENCYCQNYGGC